MMEPQWFEPTTFPVSLGRAQQLLNHPSIFPGFELPLTEHRFATRFVLLRVNELPGAAIFQGFRVVGVVVGKPLRHLLALANIKATRRIAVKNVEVKHRYEIGGADGVRTHDLLDAIEARSQLRHGPTVTNLAQRPSRFHRDALPAAPRPHRRNAIILAQVGEEGGVKPPLHVQIFRVHESGPPRKAGPTQFGAT